MASATSSTLRPKGPTWSSEEPKGNHAVAAHGAVRGLHAHHAAEACRLADGATRVGARRGMVTSPAATAAAEPPEGAAGHALRCPRGCSCGGRQKDSVDEPNANSSILALPMGVAPASSMRRTHVAVKVDSVVLEHLGGAGRARAHQVHVVLEGHGHAGQGAELLARGTTAVRLGGCSQGKNGTESLQGMPRPSRSRPLDGVEGGLGHLRLR